MEYKEFIKETVCKFDEEVYKIAKQLLIGEFLDFYIIDNVDINLEILAEKICDYFLTLEIKTGKSFDKQVESYMNDLDSIVSPFIAKTPQNKKKDNDAVSIPRARKYYEKAITNKGGKGLTIRKILDYSRIMMCLYMEIINEEYKPINNFNLSIECLEPHKIINSMRNEEISIVLPPTKRKRFDTKELFCSDTCTLILAVIAVCTVINENIRGEYTNE